MKSDFPVPTPKCFYSNQRLSTQMLILMEDLSHCKIINWDDLFSWKSSSRFNQDSEIIIDTLAKFHSKFWKNPTITNQRWNCYAIDIENLNKDFYFMESLLPLVILKSKND